MAAPWWTWWPGGPRGRPIAVLLHYHDRGPKDHPAAGGRLGQGAQTVKTALFAALSVLALAGVLVFARPFGPGDLGPLEGGWEVDTEQFSAFSAQLDAARMIGLSPPPLSNGGYAAIVDGDLLKQVKNKLSEPYPTYVVDEGLTIEELESMVAYVEPVGPGEEERESARLSAYSLALSDGSGDAPEEYCLYRKADGTLGLLFRWDPDLEPAHTVVAAYLADTLNFLQNLASQQKARNEGDGRSAFSLQLNITQVIQVSRPFAYSAIPQWDPVISDADLLEQAKELLRTTQGLTVSPADVVYKAVDGWELYLLPEAGQTRGGEVYYLYGMEGAWYLMDRTQTAFAVLPDGTIPDQLVGMS